MSNSPKNLTWKQHDRPFPLASRILFIFSLSILSLIAVFSALLNDSFEGGRIYAQQKSIDKELARSIAVREEVVVYRDVVHTGKTSIIRYRIKIGPNQCPYRDGYLFIPEMPYVNWCAWALIDHEELWNSLKSSCSRIPWPLERSLTCREGSISVKRRAGNISLAEFGGSRSILGLLWKSVLSMFFIFIAAVILVILLLIISIPLAAIICGVPITDEENRGE